MAHTLAQVQQLDAQYYMNTFGPRNPVLFVRGQGSTLYDETGKAYVDFLGGIAVNALGYGHPALTQAVCEQAQRLMHVSNLFYNEPQALLAEQLISHTALDKIFFCNSGAEANEAAIKLARKYFFEKGEERYEILSAKNSFHGRTLATVAATGQEKYQKPYRPLPTGFVNIPYNDLATAQAAVGPHTCAVLLETIQGEGGVIEADLEYLEGIAQLCREHGLLLIFDEVQTGMGRTGKLFSYEHFGVTPDILTSAKALGGGVPIGAVLAKDEVAAAFHPGDHGTTFGGNPLACAAGLAVMHTLYEGGLLDQCAATGEVFKAKLKQLAAKMPDCITDVRGKGLLLGCELAAHIPGPAVTAQLLKMGFVVNCAGHNTLRLAPPMIITQGEIDALLEALAAVLAAQ